MQSLACGACSAQALGFAALHCPPSNILIMSGSCNVWCCNPSCGTAVEEAIIALVRLHQIYTFKLSEKLLSNPLEVKQGITMSPKGGVPVTVVQRNRSGPTAVAAGA